jgi:hypothetical protein
MRKRNLILALLLLAFIGTGSTFAWWYSGLENGENEFDNTVTIGESNVKKTTTLEIGDLDDDPVLLVPYGEKDNSVNPELVEEYKVYQFAVLWKQEEAAGEGKLSVTKGTVDFKGSDDSDLSHLLLVYFSLTVPVIEDEEDFDDLAISLTDVPIVLNADDPIVVYVIVGLAQPADQDEYDLVVGQTATFTIDFLVTPNA